jgi:hypothetical protein
MRHLVVLTACLAWLVACKDKEPGSAPATTGHGAAPAASPASQGTEVIRPGDGSAAGRALARLMEVNVPLLDQDPRCAEYAQNMRSFLAALGHELRRLRELGKEGVSPEVLARSGVWLEDRARALEEISRSRALQATVELARLHRDLVAAMRELAAASSLAYGASMAAPDSAEAARVDSAVANLQATLAALEASCAAP